MKFFLLGFRVNRELRILSKVVGVRTREVFLRRYVGIESRKMYVRSRIIIFLNRRLRIRR